MSKILLSALALLLAAATTIIEQPDRSTVEVRLYRLDCGDISMDMSSFSKDGEFEGERGELDNPCFLVRHPKGDLLWDTGFEESLVDIPGGVTDGTFHKEMHHKLSGQLAELGLSPSDIDYVSLSHSHPDHAGNANHFPHSTFLVQEKEYAYMFSPERRQDKGQFTYFSGVEKAKVRKFSDNYDIFGDGTAIIQHMPGHTPGHSTLLLRLKNSGALMLSGDLYIKNKGRKVRAVATFNTDEEETLASMDRFEDQVKRENARVIIQHDRESAATLPAFPAYSD